MTDTHSNAKRLTIGYFNSDVTGEWALRPLRGAIQAARDLNVNLVAFHGQPAGTNNPLRQQDNIIYELALNGRLDGLIAWKGHLTESLGEDGTSAFYKRYGVPVVTVEGSHPGVPCVTYGNSEGVKLIVDHLVNVHGIKRIAYLGLTDNHAGFESRFRGYREALAAHALPLDDAFVQRQNMWNRTPSGEQFNRELDAWLKDIRGRGVRAIIGSCDPNATWAIERLAAIGANVPYDMSVIGFDGFRDSRLSSPPLTTVDPDWGELGRRAVGEMVRLITRGSIPELVMVSPRLAIAESCGCVNSSLVQAGSRSGTANRTALAAEIDSYLGERKGKRLGDSLVRAFFGDSFERTLDLSLRECFDGDDDHLAWQNAISALERASRTAFPLRARRDAAARRCSRARLLVETLAMQKQEIIRSRIHERKNGEMAFGLELISNFDLESIAATLASGLPGLSVDRAYVSLYEDPRPYRYPDPAPEYSRLVFAMEAGVRVPLPADGLRFPSRLLVPDELGSWEGHNVLTVQCLRYRDRQIGFGVFDVGKTSGAFMDSLSAQISSALQGALLLGQVNRQYDALGKGVISLGRSMGDMTSHIETISESVGKQSAAVEESASSIQQMTGNIQSVAGVSEHAATVSRDLDEIAEKSIASIKALLKSIKIVQEKSGDVKDLLLLIHDVSDRTKLLSLNAAIEAARAGASGKGFGVVAKEIRALAESAESSVTRISTVIETLNGEIARAGTLSSGIGGDLDGIVKGLQTNANGVAALKDAMREQSSGAEELLRAIAELVEETTEIKDAVAAQARATGEFKNALSELDTLLEKRS